MKARELGVTPLISSSKAKRQSTEMGTCSRGKLFEDKHTTALQKDLRDMLSAFCLCEVLICCNTSVLAGARVALHEIYWSHL